MTDMKNREKIGAINFQYFVVGCFHGESVTINMIEKHYILVPQTY